MVMLYGRCWDMCDTLWRDFFGHLCQILGEHIWHMAEFGQDIS